MAQTKTTQTLTSTCPSCGETHQAEPAHLDVWSGAQLYAVVCTVDWLTDYVTAEMVAGL